MFYFSQFRYDNCQKDFQKLSNDNFKTINDEIQLENEENFNKNDIVNNKEKNQQQKENMHNHIKVKTNTNDNIGDEEEEEKIEDQRLSKIAENLVKDEEDEEENNNIQNNSENNENKKDDEKLQKKKVGIKILMQNKELKKKLIPGLKNSRKIKKNDEIKVEEEKIIKKREIGIYEVIGNIAFFLIQFFFYS